MPIMKDEIKNAKKAVSSLKREGVSEEVLAQSLDRLNKENEIYESISQIMEVSSAALRVKANVVVAQADTFRSLIGNE